MKPEVKHALLLACACESAKRTLQRASETLSDITRVHDEYLRGLNVKDKAEVKKIIASAKASLGVLDYNKISGLIH